MRSRLLLIGTVLAAASVLSGCALLPTTGPRVTEEIAVADIDAVELATSCDLTVTLGDASALTVTAGEEIIDRLTAEVVDGVLRLDMEEAPFGWTGEIRYELTVTAL